MKMKRILAVVFVMCLLLTATTAFAAKTIKLSHLNPQQPFDVATAAMSAVFKSMVEAQSNGELLVEIYPASPLTDPSSNSSPSSLFTAATISSDMRISSRSCLRISRVILQTSIIKQNKALTGTAKSHQYIVVCKAVETCAFPPSAIRNPNTVRT